MKRTLRYAICLLACAACMAGCSKEKAASSGEGVLCLSVNMPQAKAAMTPEELEQSALVNIYKADFTGLVRSYRKSEISGSIYLPADEYRVDVKAGELSKENPAKLSWEQKSYKGSSPFTIVAGTVSNVTVTAKVYNIVSRITFDESIAANLDEGYTLSIGFDLSGAESPLAVYDASRSGAEAYFLTDDVEPTLYWEFKGVRSKTGTQVYKSGMIENTLQGSSYNLSPKFVVKDGDLGFDLLVDYDIESIDDLVVFEPVSTGIVESKPYEIWATKMTAHADVDEASFPEGSKVEFSYSADGIEWTEVEGERVEAGSYQALISGLAPDTVYQYALLVGGTGVGEIQFFQTDKATQVPNNSFEIYSNAEKSSYKSFYDPANPLCSKKFWDNGNEGASTLGSSYLVCTPDTDDKMDGEVSARCRSQYVIVKFAAGSISSCEYAGTNGTNGYVNFGRPFTARPSAVRLWYKYNGGIINRSDDSALNKGVSAGKLKTKPVVNETPDSCTFMCALGNWPKEKYLMKTPISSGECVITAYTADINTFYNYETLPETIAYGYVAKTESPNKDWEQITIPFDYHTTEEIPTHIILSFAASKFGDYFTGYDKAELKVDKVELLYE